MPQKTTPQREAQDTNPNHTGVMIALALPLTIREQLTAALAKAKIVEPTPTDEFHLTLAYWGEDTQRPFDTARLTEVVTMLARQHLPIKGRLNGIGRFTAVDEGGDMSAFYASFDAVELPALRERVLQFLVDNGFPPVLKHGFTPHITLAYLPNDAPTPSVPLPTGNILLENLILAHGGEWQLFPLGREPESEVIEGDGRQVEYREFETDGLTGREWDVTLIGRDPSNPDSLITVDGEDYILSKNGLPYAVAGLKAGVSLWDGALVYDNHLTDAEFKDRGGMRSPANEWVGNIVAPYWDEKAKALKGTLKMVDAKLAEKIRQAHEQGLLQLGRIGLSIDTFPTYKTINVNGRSVKVAAGWSGTDKINSVDIVMKPAAGGTFNRMIAAQQPQKETLMELSDEMKAFIAEQVATAVAQAMAAEAARVQQEQANTPPAATPASNPTAEAQQAQAVATAAAAVAPVTEAMRKLECRLQLRDALDAAKLPDALRGIVEAQFANKVFETAELEAAVKRAKEAYVELDKTGRVAGTGNGRNTESGISVGLDGRDVAANEFMRLAMGNTDFRKLESLFANDLVADRVPESYKAWVKGGRPNYGTRRLSEWCYQILGGDPLVDQRAHEAITTSGMSSIIKNAMNVMLAANYAKRHLWWESIVREEEVDTIDQATLVRVFGMNTLSVVDEGQPYNELSWDDEEETAAFVKKGNYVGVTLETLLRDKLGVVRSIPDRLATSWYNTLSALVSGVFTVNSAAGPVLADTGALFNATAATTAGGHANLLTTALSYASYGSARTAMKKQTDRPLGVGQRLMIEPKFLLVPTDLERTAAEIRDSEYVPGQDAAGSTAGNQFQTKNQFQGKFEVIEVPNWTDTDNWALVADPEMFPAIWLIFLRGKKVPELFTADNETAGAMFTNDTLRYKVRMMTYRFSSTYDCAPVSDFRPLHKSNV